MSDWSKDSNVTKKKIYGAGTILALIISIPGIIAFIIANSVIDNFFISITITSIFTTCCFYKYYINERVIQLRNQQNDDYTNDHVIRLPNRQEQNSDYSNF